MNILDLIKSNISVERQLESVSVPEYTWQTNPNPQPGTYVIRRVDPPCRFCSTECWKTTDCAERSALCDPTCKYCNESKYSCGCTLGKLHKEIKRLGR